MDEGSEKFTETFDNLKPYRRTDCAIIFWCMILLLLVNAQWDIQQDSKCVAGAVCIKKTLTESSQKMQQAMWLACTFK